MFLIRPLICVLFALHAGPATASNGTAYLVVPDFPQLPEGMKLGAVSAVATDAKGDVFVFQRGDPPILVFDAGGNFLRSLGKNAPITSAHGLRIDPDGNLWTTDYVNHTVLKLSPAGDLLLTLGIKDKRGNDEKHFNRPTDVAFGKNGDVYVSDGYGNSRVVKFDKNGKFLMTWGTKGTGDGELNLPHAVRVDSKGHVYVGDRENNRIQVFDADGKFLRKIEGFAPYGLFITPDDTLFVADGRANRVIKMTTEGKVLATWGEKGKAAGQFNLPHGVTVGADGSVYVGEIDGKRVQKFTPAGKPE